MLPIWGIRVASSRRHGAGHVRRCIALAAELPERARFFLDCHLWGEALAAQGFGFEVEGSSSRSSLALSALRNGALRGMIFDGYSLRQEDAAQAMNLGLVVHLDDGVVKFPAHCRIKPGGIEAVTGDLLPRAFSGLQYALLDHAFAAAHRRAVCTEKLSLPGRCRLLISMGARDSKNVTEYALESCAGLAEIRVVMGGQADHILPVTRAVERIEGADMIVDCADMIAEYERADLAIGAGGVSLPERMCCGLPSLVIAQSENQRHNISVAQDAGAVVFLGEAEQNNREVMRRTVRNFIDSAEKRDGVRMAGLELVDGLGARRAGIALGRLLKEFEDGLLSL